MEFGATDVTGRFQLDLALTRSVAGAWPMAMKTPSAATLVSAPVLTFF